MAFEVHYKNLFEMQDKTMFSQLIRIQATISVLQFVFVGQYLYTIEATYISSVQIKCYIKLCFRMQLPLSYSIEVTLLTFQAPVSNAI